MNLVLFNHNYIYLIKRVNINFTFFLFDIKKHQLISPSYSSLRVEIIIPNPSSIDKPSLYLLSKF